MGLLRSDENYRLIHCLVKTNKDLLTFFLPQSLSSPVTITELLEELLEVRAGPSSLFSILQILLQMEHHRYNEGNTRLHFKYTRLQYKLRDTGYALVTPREDDLPGITKTGQIRFHNNKHLLFLMTRLKIEEQMQEE